MSLNPIKPVTTDNYELIELSPGAFYRTRKTYSPMVKNDLDYALIQRGRQELAKELGVELNSEQGRRISDDMGEQWYNYTMFYRDVTDLTQDEEYVIENGEVQIDSEGNFLTRPKVDKDGNPVMIAKLKYRNFWNPPVPITQTIVKTLCKPINGAPDPLTIWDDLDPEAVGKVIGFFYSCRQKPIPIDETKPEPTTDSNTSGEAVSTTSPENSDTKKEKTEDSATA